MIHSAAFGNEETELTGSIDFGAHMPLTHRALSGRYRSFCIFFVVVVIAIVIYVVVSSTDKK
jgi:hypothetical protein